VPEAYVMEKPNILRYGKYTGDEMSMSIDCSTDQG
jgi:hypothetical protein